MKRKFMLGSEWLYYKVYAGLKIQDSLLVNEIYEISNLLKHEGLIDKFFFVRYSDELGAHLRLRFHFVELENIFKTVQLMEQKLSKYLETRAISSIMIDVYNREIERYGDVNIEDIETLFSVNSFEVLELLKFESYKMQFNWLNSLMLIDNVLNITQIDTYQKHTIMEELFQSFSKNKSALIIKAIKDKQREHKSDVEVFIHTKRDKSKLNTESLDIHNSTEYLAIQKIATRYNKDYTNYKLTKIIKDLIHMSINRFFTSNQNTYELLLYYMLSHYYKSQAIKSNIAIKKH